MEIVYNENKLYKRLFATIIAVVFFVCVLLINAFRLTVLGASNIVYKGLGQWYRSLPVSAKRGSIIDRNGEVLSSSYTTYDVYVRPAGVKNVADMAFYLAKHLGCDESEVYEKIAKRNYSEIKIASNVEKQVVQNMLNNYHSGLYFAENTTRNYETGDMLSQILGFVSSDGHGQTGLENYYDKYLYGVNGTALTASDLKGKELDGYESNYIPAIDGLSITLTIDAGINRILDDEIKGAYLNNSALSASGIIMNPKTGEILAISTKPSLDLSNIDRSNVGELMRLAKATAITDAYEPGSTFKIITTAIALNEGLTSEHDFFYCPGFRIVNGVKISCHRHSGHGSQSLADGLCNSCNCVFMELIHRIGVNKFYEYLKAFGLETGYNLDFPGEGKAVTMPEFQVTASDLLRMGFGQSVAVTPLGLITAVSAAINGGNLMQPYFVKEIASSSGNIVYSRGATIIRRVLSHNVSLSLNRMLQEVVDRGGGKKAAVAGYDIAGKTGTAQKYENGVVSHGKYVASFLGYAPADDPEYILLVVIDEPKGAYYGGSIAAPVAHNVFERLFELKQIEANENLEADRLALAPTIKLPNFSGMTLTEAARLISSLGLQYLTQGEGKRVVSQISEPGTLVCLGDIVLLIFGDDSYEID